MAEQEKVGNVLGGALPVPHLPARVPRVGQDPRGSRSRWDRGALPASIDRRFQLGAGSGARARWSWARERMPSLRNTLFR